MSDLVNDILRNALALYLEAAPWLLLGLLMAGLVKAWVKQDRMRSWLGGHGVWPVLKAAVVGAPLPLCSCGVVPAALTLHRAGAPRGPTVSFLIATPETGVDSVAVSYALLGPFFTVLRPLAAILSAVFAGLLADWMPAATPVAPPATSCGGSCCGSSCRTTEDAESPSGFWAETASGLRYALTDVVDDIALWMAIGLLLAGLMVTVVPPMTLASWGSGLPAMLLMLLVGVPMYICATSSTPLAAALLIAGVSPGTVLVFLLAGPATNLATLGILRREFGSRVLAVYLLGIGVGSIGLGLLTDTIVGRFQIDVAAQAGVARDVFPSWVSVGACLVLLIFALRPIRNRLFKR
jgi:uncharacterized membrane protein YraQ (UPF0718 family)